MFKEARIELTIWYVVISMVISAIFSIAIYARLHRDFAANQRRFELRIQQQPLFDPDFDNRIQQQRQDMNELENRLEMNLLLINVAVLGLSALAGYFLAGRTLKPIQEMVDKQNQFIADASHELRTPLTAMKTSIEVNLRDKKLTATSAKNVLEENLQDVDTMRRLSDDLLSLARIQNQTTETYEAVSLKEIIQLSIENIKNLAKEKHINIDQSIKDAAVWGSKERLVQLMTIFLDNAIKYSKQRTKIQIKTTVNNSIAQIDIKDQGIGISPEDIPHIFERFYRADKSRSHERTDGYGLGLSIAQEIISAHHGSINVQSRVKQGTTFTIKLPVKK